MTGRARGDVDASGPATVPAPAHGLRPRRRHGWVVVLLVGVLVGAGTVWAAGELLAPVAPELEERVSLSVRAERGAIGRELSFVATASWEGGVGPAGRRAGTVTSLELSVGEPASSGQVIYTVDLQPVVIAQGEVPAFRELAQGAVGDDVAQLQELLTELGHFSGTVDGRFGTGTTTAVRAWQRELGTPVDGRVADGLVIFVPDPALRLVPAAGIGVGSTVAPGEVVVEVLPPEPTFGITLAPEQLDLVPLQGRAFVEHAGGEWPAIIGQISETAEGQVVMALVAADGGPVCADACATALQVPGTTTLRTRLEVVPHTEGIVLPASALRTHADGRVYVRTVDGDDLDVVVRGSADGLAVVDGIEEGTEVQVPDAAERS